METLMMVPASSGRTELVVDHLSRAVAAHLARYRGQSRLHTAPDLRSYLGWCAERRLDPLAASRVYVELWIRWMQEIRHLQPATVSRRVSVVAGFYRTCVIDAVLAASPAEYVRRPRVSAESPTLGLTHLQFMETARGGRDTGPILRNRRGTRMDRHCATPAAPPRPYRGRAPAADTPAHAAAHLCHHHARRRRGPARCVDRGPLRRPTHHHALRVRKNLDRHPNYILAAHMASGT